MSASATCKDCGSVLVLTVNGQTCTKCNVSAQVTIEAGTLVDPGRTRVGESSLPSGPPPGPERIGDYELIEEIAHGGMGVVFKARQVSLDRIVALKMIRGERLANATDIRRFHLEAQAAGRLQHPNIVAI